MKYILKIVAIVLFLVWSNLLYAQDAGYYEIYVNTPSVRSNGSANNGGGTIKITAGDQTFQEKSWGEFSSGNVLNAGESDTHKFLATAKPNYIEFFGNRHGHDSWPASGSWKYEETSYLYIAGYYPYFSGIIYASYAGYDDAATILIIKPDIVKLFYFDTYGNASGNMQLPTDDNITLKASTDFSNEVYANLFYKISTSGATGTVPMGVSTKTFKGLDFLSESTLDNIIKNRGTINFNVNYPNANSCPIITLTPMLSAPHIVSVTTDTVICHGERTGKIKIRFDRALKTGERLYVTLRGDEFRESEVTTMTSNNEVTLTGLAAGTYNVGLIGTYDATVGGTVNTYTTGLNHSRTAIVHDRPALTLSNPTQNSVHCKNGMDGKINFNVSGGNSRYNTYLLAANALDTLQRLSGSALNYSFTDLPQGNYYVYVKDGNGCDKDISEAKTQKSITVLEPTDSTQIFLIASREATGFGRSTGWAEVGARGGSDGYAFTWEKQNPLTIMPQTSGTAETSRLENLPTNYYLATVKDQNYSQANPPTEVNLRGCYDTITIFIDQPPKIIATVRETHIVTCHGDDDGQLTVNVTGGRPFQPFQQPLPYNYQWYKIVNGSDVEIGNNDSILSNMYTGYYKVMVSDSNRIDTTSLVFHLIQPDTLIATTTALQQVMCDGDSTGRAEVTVIGGTPPYTYQWTTDNNDTTIVIEHLPRNIYTVFVKDSRYRNEAAHKRCTAQAYVNIKSPNGVQADATVTNPTCNGYTDGKIEISITGGTSPYRALWENNQTVINRTNLGDGTYKIKITDNNDCSISEEYTLTEPAPVVVNLSGDFTLCAEQQLTVRDKNTHENVSYEWKNNGNVVSSEPELLVGAEGKYKLTVSTPEGCVGSDEIQVEQSDDVLHTNFVIASFIPRGKPIHAVNIITTKYDSVEWILPDEAIIFDKTDDDVEMSFLTTGEYTVGFIAYLGKCRDILYKTTKVVEQWEIDEYADEEPFLKRFMVFPNPNDGNFSASVELREAADYVLNFYNENGALLDSKERKNKISEEIPFTYSLGAGIYYLQFISKEHKSTFKVIIR